MNITWEEIRDIIEKEIYIGSGTILGVSDAAKAIKTRIEAVEHSVQADEKPCPLDHKQLAQTGSDVCHECGEVAVSRR